MSDCWCTKNYTCLSCERQTKPKIRRQSTIRKVAQCGTRAGYNKHLRLGEPTCEACRAAQTAAVSRFQRSKKEVA